MFLTFKRMKQYGARFYGEGRKMKRLESLVCLFVTLVEKRGSILDFYRPLDSRLRGNDRRAKPK